MADFPTQRLILSALFRGMSSLSKWKEVAKMTIAVATDSLLTTGLPHLLDGILYMEASGLDPNLDANSRVISG